MAIAPDSAIFLYIKYGSLLIVIWGGKCIYDGIYLILIEINA